MRRPIWDLDELDVAGIEEFLMLIKHEMAKFDPDAPMKDRAKAQLKMLLYFDQIADLASHATVCLKNGGPEPGRDKLEDSREDIMHDPVLKPIDEEVEQ